MKIISYNIRGLRKGVKKATIRKLVKKRIYMLCLQETKKEQIDKVVCQALWGDSKVSWELQLACNRAGEILYVYGVNKLSNWRRSSMAMVSFIWMASGFLMAKK